MTTTTTTAIGFGLGGAAGAGLAIAAAGALTLGAVAAAGILGGRRNNRRGGRRRYYGRRRWGREATESKDSEASEAEKLKSFLNIIRQQDFTGCALKLVCKLSGMNESELTERQRDILNLVQLLPSPGEGILPPGGAMDYKVTAILGSQGMNCEESFPSCPWKGSELMNLIDSYIP